MKIVWIAWMTLLLDGEKIAQSIDRLSWLERAKQSKSSALALSRANYSSSHKSRGREYSKNN